MFYGEPILYFRNIIYSQLSASETYAKTNELTKILHSLHNISVNDILASASRSPCYLFFQIFESNFYVFFIFVIG